jgi:O-antigen/teichoic acid export membrane protein
MKLLHNLFWQFLNHGLGRAALWLFFMFIPIWLGPEGYGKFSFAFSISMIAAAVFFQARSDLVVIRQVRENDESVLSLFFWLRVLFCACALLVLAGARLTHPRLEIYLWLLGYWFFWSLQDLYFAYLRSREQMRLEGIIGLAQKLLALLLLFWLGGLRGGRSETMPAVALCLATGAGLAAVLIFSPPLRERTCRWLRRGPSVKIKKPLDPALKEIGLLGLIALLATVHFHIDKVMLGLLASTRVVGWYTLTVRLVEAFLVLPALVMAVFYPRLVRSGDNSRSVSVFLFWGLLLSATLLAFAARLLAAPLIPLIWGQGFAPAGGVFRVLVFSIIPIYPGYLVTQQLVAARRTKAYLYISLAGCAINIALNLLWIPLWQASGAAWATIVSEASVTIGGVLALRHNPFSGSPGKPRP